MNNISIIRNCSGCMACAEKCPKQCIKAKADSIGHLFPAVDESVCIDCGACLKVCPTQTVPAFQKGLKVFAAWRKNESALKESSSGGLAAVLSEAVVAEGGVVYGCAFIPPFGFNHIRCSTANDLRRLKGSKYVQSDMGTTYTSIADDLKADRKVLFIGTPCQVAGVKRYFHGKDNKLYTIDILCHGVPSAQLLKDSLPAELWSHEFDSMEFRACTKYYFSVKNGISTVFDRPLCKDLYMKGFFTALYYRSSCYSCPYARKERIGDITLGDFWGVNTEIVKGDAEKGISLCMQNNQKGEELLDMIKREVNMAERPLEEALAGNKQLNYPMPRSFRTRIFSMLYPMLGFNWAVRLSIPEIIVKNMLVRH